MGRWTGAGEVGSTEPPWSTTKVANQHEIAFAERAVVTSLVTSFPELLVGHTRSSKREGASAVVACGVLRYARRKSARSDGDVERLDFRSAALSVWTKHSARPLLHGW
ncbi:hypothetical protein MTO96_020007 [Rhipicephalus appendiculatus]